MGRSEYIRVLNDFYLKNQASLLLIFKYYVENDGIIKDMNQFFNTFANDPRADLGKAMRTVIVHYNLEFNIMMITKENKFIMAL